jgi:peptidyl-dipeptidase A
MWRESYESPTFVQDVEDLWSQVEPLYVQLHKYVSNKLKEVHGDKLDISDGLLPAHVLGDMFAQRWVPLARVVKPFPNASTVDIDQALADQKYTVLEMFKTADHFFKSMGLLPNDICYNTSAGAVIEKPSDGREVFSQPQALDFCDGQNYR